MDIKNNSTQTVTLSVDEIRKAIEMYLKEHGIKDINRDDIDFRYKPTDSILQKHCIPLDSCVLVIVKDSPGNES